jgi:hypothetical protein
MTRRIQAIQENQKARNKYLKALDDFRWLQVFDALREKVLMQTPVYTGTSHGMARDLYEYHRICGYMECLSDIEHLLDKPLPVYKHVATDFGARDELRKKGFSEEELSKIFGEE